MSESWDDAIHAIESGARRVTSGPMSEAPLAKGATLPSHRTRCAVCSRFAEIDASARCYGCRPKPPICDCGGELRHDAVCPTARAIRCAWCGVTVRAGREPYSHGMCASCSLSFESPSGVRLEVEADAEAERVARCERAGVKP